MSHADYVLRYRAAVEAAMSEAVYETFRNRTEDPVAAIGRQLLLLDTTAATSATPAGSSSAGVGAGEAGVACEWTMLDCAKIAGVDAAVASTLRRHVGDGIDALEFLRGLNDVIDMRKSLILDIGEAVVDALAQLGRTNKLQVCMYFRFVRLSAYGYGCLC